MGSNNLPHGPEILLCNSFTSAREGVLLLVLVACLRLFDGQPGVDHPVKVRVQPSVIDALRMEFFEWVLEAHSFYGLEPVSETEEMDLKDGEVARNIINRKIN